MTQVAISSKYQIVIPSEIRKRLNIKSGQKLQILVKDGIMTLVPDRSLESLRGFVQGIDIRGYREEEDRL
ncbi:MAG: AbrB/MazE/SpoVT family DNA-binding domain-containing protein [bacterium]|nr:AbrB/MazE/SpoVT family DNA-binding domain-containing protein [bacterium]